MSAEDPPSGSLAPRHPDEEAANELGPETLVPVEPSRQLRARLMNTLDGVDRFAPFFDPLARLFQLPVTSIRTELARIDGTAWESGLLGVELPGAELFHFQIGPDLAASGAAGGVLRIRAGGAFPRHRHLGHEVTFVLEGGYCEDNRVLGPGSVIEMSEATSHDYRAASERDLVLVVLHRGIALEPG